MNNISVAGIVKIIIGLFLAVVGMFYIIFPETITILTTPITRILGVLFFARGIFRVYSVYKTDFRNDF